MKTKSVFLVIVALVSSISPAFSVEIESESAAHHAAHFGMSYAITHATEVVCNKITQKKIPCTIAGAVLAASAGIYKESLDGEGDNHAKAYLMNAAGIAAAVTLISIDF